VALLITGLLVFLGIHSVSIVAPAWRDRMAGQMGLAWRGLYSIISLIGFVLIIRGFASARLTPEILYVPPSWMRHVTMTLMLPVFPLLLATYLPGRIKTTMKHPMLVAIKLWAVAHLLANGMLADVLLFGGFLLWAVLDRISLKRRPVRAITALPATAYNDWLAVIGGLAIYVVNLLWAHAKLIGVALI
jgi:uncharacterized membrane protein